MKIFIKTTLITLEVNDEVHSDKSNSSGYGRHTLPELLPAIEAAITEAIRLHNEIKK